MHFELVDAVRELRALIQRGGLRDMLTVRIGEIAGADALFIDRGQAISDHDGGCLFYRRFDRSGVHDLWIYIAGWVDAYASVPSVGRN
jgi:hypothetical protein